MDTKRLQELAGIFLIESEDDDDLSPAERELAKKADTDLKKKGIDVDAAMKKADERKAARTTAPAKDEKKDDKPAAAADEKKEEAPAASAKKMHQAVDWFKSNKEATRSQFMAQAEKWGMSRNFANVAYYKIKKRLAECYVLVHPSVARFALAHNRAFNRYQWINLEESEGLEPLILETRAEADKVNKFLLEYKSQVAVVEKIDFDV
jgi:hypothetical protein